MKHIEEEVAMPKKPTAKNKEGICEAGSKRYSVWPFGGNFTGQGSREKPEHR